MPPARETPVSRSSDFIRALVADILLAAVFDSDAFDQLLSGAVTSNEEGRVVTADDSAGVPFSWPAFEEFLRAKPMQPAGGAALALA